MNALWIRKMCAYKNSPLALESAKKLIRLKAQRQALLLRKFRRVMIVTDIAKAQDLSNALLAEARAAKSFWKEFGRLLPGYLVFPGRKARSKDTANILLDIGYRHLANTVRRILIKYNIPTELALLHVAHRSKSDPLVYDLMEMFRADVVDAEVLRFLRLKKKKIAVIEEEIGRFLEGVNQRIQRKYYLKDFKQCHTYQYYMEVQILKFVGAVNRRRVFKPMILPNRHDMRCSLPRLDSKIERMLLSK